ncbi:hypothetical protein SAMN05192559_101509 [Halobacillus karajensis]|uniref:Uncharacterized protein n=1 Tax=Halobacillus karajensis TaxID=195088 RepID=A0A024P507_9BACI|nr:hypothetical protein [Halobacillus karajensis]CDQ18855.1 hypothetical protein BN982_01136 [Halobacillus karajensis]CDQ23072.1 hypothetical protein BN983_01291 [Halobacillus karajensis]CDQ26554.1 hypothetical protein BN981_00771 [Halobacillus karajensis]SEH45187.1 hypothetical protein SAMN05192559_101509 [Halobacillus karajensis]
MDIAALSHGYKGTQTLSSNQVGLLWIKAERKRWKKETRWAGMLAYPSLLMIL